MSIIAVFFKLIFGFIGLVIGLVVGAIGLVLGLAGGAIGLVLGILALVGIFIILPIILLVIIF